ncbi:MAG: DUF1080 domain-containing protein [Planctomycetes bacterium]|nr:DUF1080 domain-containing protein [Planctomycetota bacterium]
MYSSSLAACFPLFSRFVLAALCAVTTGLCAQSTDEDRVFDASSWRALFAGKEADLAREWTKVGGRYDGKADWRFEDGCIVGREGANKAGGLLYTNEHWQGFRLSLEIEIAEPFDSGIFLFMVPREKATEGRTAQDRGIQVTLDARPGGEIGGIYADGWLQHNEKGWEHWRSGAWNRVEMHVRGLPPRVTTWLNGKPLSDYTLPETLVPQFAPTGRIGIQVHGGGAEGSYRARFRDIRIQEVPVYASADFDCNAAGFLSPKHEDAGWKNLLEGDSLDGWRATSNGTKNGSSVRDGVLSFAKDGGDGTLATVDEYEDFELRLDFKIAEMANSGLFLRAAPEGNPAYSGCEIQILDDFHWEDVTKSKLKPFQFTGGLYGSLAPSSHKVLFDIGRWNTYRVRYVGSRLRVELNGRELYDVDTHALEPVQGKPFSERAARGFIGLQRHAPREVTSAIWAQFKNLWVRRLSPAGGPSKK